MAVQLEDRKRVTTGLKSWLDCVSQYERAFKAWESRVEKIEKRYRDDGRRSTDQTAKFNILWSNVQTLQAATFAKLPKPDVTRRFRDNDPVGRVAALLLERALEYEVQHYSDYRWGLKQCVQDRFLGGRGTAWVRYEPHFKVPDQPSGAQVTEDVDEPDEQLDYECSPVDYVHWRDFGHEVARTWEEVGRVWRVVYMPKAELEKRFGKDKAKLIPLDGSPEEFKKQENYRPEVDTAAIYEGWDKRTKRVVWFSKSVKDFLDERDDPLGLCEFFPCPRPIYASLTNETLKPVPDFTLYQDQAMELDTLADRIDGLVKALQVKGVYDGAIPELGRIFTEGVNGQLIGVKNWAAFAEKNGLKGALELIDLDPIGRALKECYLAFEQVKSQVYEVSGISDIIRGNTDAAETATAQQIKGQYASLRLKQYQEEVALFATELLRIKAQIICGKYAPQTIAQMAAAQQLDEVDQQFIAPALALLVGEERMLDPEAEDSPNPLRSFRIEVAADSLLYLDEQQEKQDRVELLAAISKYLLEIGQALSQVPPEVAAPLAGMSMKLLKFGVTGFRIGKSIEGEVDAAADKIVQGIMAQQGKPDPEAIKAQSQAEAEKQKMQNEREMHGEKLNFEREKHQQSMAFEQQKHQQDLQMRQQDMQMRQVEGEQQRALDIQKHEQSMGLEKERVEQHGQVEMEKAKQSGKPSAHIQIDAEKALMPLVDEIKQMVQAMLNGNVQQAQLLAQTLEQGLGKVEQAAKAPRVHDVQERDATGRIRRSVSRAA